MKYAIIGSGKIGTALARVFARNDLEVGTANSRGPESLVSLTKELGASVVPQTHSGPQTVQEGAIAIVRLAQLPEDGPTGSFTHKDGIYPW